MAHQHSPEPCACQQAPDTKAPLCIKALDFAALLLPIYSMCEGTTGDSCALGPTRCCSPPQVAPRCAAMTARSRWLCRWPKLEASAVSQADAAPQEEKKEYCKTRATDT